MHTKQGFTIIELLVVIAIIAVISGIIMTALTPARERSRVSSALQSLSIAKTAVYSCLQEAGEMTVPSVGSAICDPSTDGLQIWPPLPTSEWYYDTNTAMSDQNQSKFLFDAVGDGVRITCTETGCVSVAE